MVMESSPTRSGKERGTLGEQHCRSEEKKNLLKLPVKMAALTRTSLQPSPHLRAETPSA
jgi:hypothetical protein